MKALTNLVSAGGFLIGIEALLIGSRFASTGADGRRPQRLDRHEQPTQKKFRQFVLSRRFDRQLRPRPDGQGSGIALAVARGPAPPPPSPASAATSGRAPSVTSAPARPTAMARLRAPRRQHLGRRHRPSGLMGPGTPAGAPIPSTVSGTLPSPPHKRPLWVARRTSRRKSSCARVGSQSRRRVARSAQAARRIGRIVISPRAADSAPARGRCRQGARWRRGSADEDDVPVSTRPPAPARRRRAGRSGRASGPGACHHPHGKPRARRHRSGLPTRVARTGDDDEVVVEQRPAPSPIGAGSRSARSAGRLAAPQSGEKIVGSRHWTRISSLRRRRRKAVIAAGRNARPRQRHGADDDPPDLAPRQLGNVRLAGRARRRRAALPAPAPAPPSASIPWPSARTAPALTLFQRGMWRGVPSTAGDAEATHGEREALRLPHGDQRLKLRRRRGQTQPPGATASERAVEQREGPRHPRQTPCPLVANTPASCAGTAVPRNRARAWRSPG